MKKHLDEAGSVLFAARQPLRKLLGSIIFAALAFFFIRVAADNYGTWSQQLAHVNLVLLVLSVVVSLASFLFETWIWRLLVAKFHVRISFLDAFQIFYLTNLTRYVPGRIWQTSAAMVWLKTYGVPLKKSAMISVVSQVATLVAALLVSLPLLYLWYNSYGLSWQVVMSGIVICGGLSLVVLFPNVWLGWLNHLFVRFGQNEIAPSVDRIQFLRLLVLYFMMWLTAGFGFYLLLLGFYPVNIETLPFIVAASAFAYVIGYLLLFAPGGLVIREGVLVIVLSVLMPNSIATLVAVASRFWLMAIELGLGAIALFLFVRSSERNNSFVRQEK